MHAWLVEHANLAMIISYLSIWVSGGLCMYFCICGAQRTHLHTPFSQQGTPFPLVTGFLMHVSLFVRPLQAVQVDAIT